MPQLDGLRTVAAVAVAWCHWVSREYHFGLPWGVIGVQLFFVLSGYLITGILLVARERGGTTPAGRRFAIRNFYMRRSLRIFPLYYVMGVVCIVVAFPPAREVAGWLFTYTMNIYFFLRQGWYGHMGHFWTLGVEEQFYAMWPWFIMFLPRRWVSRVLVLAMVTAFVSRVTIAIVWPHVRFANMLPFGAMDALGGGALLAVLGSRSERGVVYARGCLAVGLALCLVVKILISCGTHSPLINELRHFSLVAMFVWVVDGAARGFKGPVGAVLKSRPLVELGRVSYGFYIIHYFVPFMLQAAAVRGWVPRILMTGWPRLAVTLVATLALVYASWHFFEKPINRLKNRFPYVKAGTDT